MRRIKPRFGLRPNPGHPQMRNLRGWWLMNEGGGRILHDISGYSNHGDATNWVTGSWVPTGLLQENIPNNARQMAVYTTNNNVKVNVGDRPAIQNIFHGELGGGTYTGWWKPDSDGTNDSGRVFEKGSTFIWTGLQSGNNVTVNFQISFSGTNSRWRLTTPNVNVNYWNHVAICYDASSTGNTPLIYVNGESQSVTNVLSPTGTATSDAGSDGHFFDREASPSRGWDGMLDDQRLYKGMLTRAEILDIMYNPYAAFPSLSNNIERNFDVAAVGAWPNNINTVASASIGAVNGVSAANIGKINGIS